jgi:hypothetical protein
MNSIIISQCDNGIWKLSLQLLEIQDYLHRYFTSDRTRPESKGIKFDILHIRYFLSMGFY